MLCCSDFFAFKACPFIELDDLSFETRYSASGLVSVCNVSQIWRRYYTSAFLGLTESQFVELCLYVGNDYINDSTGSLLRTVEEKEVHGSNEDAWNFIRDIKTKSPEYKLFAGNADLNSKYQFCRDLYDLKDLSDYPYDENDNSSSAFIIDENIIASISELVKVQGKMESMEHNLIAACRAVAPTVISESQQLSLSNSVLMLQKELEIPAALGELYVPSWSDCEAAILFQLIYKLLRETLEPGALASDQKELVCDYFLHEHRSILSRELFSLNLLIVFLVDSGSV